MVVVNRVKEDLQMWLAREMEYTELAGSGRFDTKFQMEKLAFLDVLAVRYRRSLSPEEKLTMIHIDRVRKDIEKNHLGFWEKLFRWKDESKRDAAIENRELKEIEQLYSTVAGLGFNNLREDIRKAVEQGGDFFQHPCLILQFLR